MNFPDQASFLPYRPAAWLHVSGSDAPGFLQGQFSNDLSAAGEAAVYGLFLDAKGRIRGDGTVLRRGPDFRIFSQACPGRELRERLESFIIADDVTVEDATAEVEGLALVGEGTGAWLAAAGAAGFRFPGRRGAAENWEWILPAAEAERVRAALAPGREERPEAAERRRIEAGIPLVPADLGPADLPHEGGIERQAVSTEKGCYVGQEVMARLKAKGRVRRRLCRVAGSGAAPAVGTPLWQGEVRAGEMRTSAPGAGGGFVGLAMLSLLRLRPEAPLAAAGGAPAIALAERIIV
jgi:tRNA-modifying protein YgfZ